MNMLRRIKTKLLERYPALKHRNFRYFLAGQCISLIGTWMQRTAQQWVVYQLTKSPLILGLVGVCQFTPALCFSLFAGVLVDRFPKKQFLIVTQTMQMLQAFILTALIWSGRIQYWHILILAGFLGLANTFDMPTRQSFFIELVGKEDLVSAIGLNSTIVNLGRIVGPTVAGLFLASFGATSCFLVNGLSFVAVLIGLHFIKAYAVNIRKKSDPVLREMVDGLKYIFANRRLTDAVLTMLINGIFAMNSDIIIPVFAKEVLHQQVNGYSLMLSAMGVGSLAGSLLFATRRESGWHKGLLFKAAFMLASFLIATSLMHNYYGALCGVAAVGLCNMVLMATVNSTIQLNSNDQYRGRAMSVYTLVLTGTSPFGNFLIGLVTDRFGANIGFLFSGGVTMVLLGLLISVRRKLISIRR